MFVIAHNTECRKVKSGMCTVGWHVQAVKCSTVKNNNNILLVQIDYFVSLKYLKSLYHAKSSLQSGSAIFSVCTCSWVDVRLQAEVKKNCCQQESHQNPPEKAEESNQPIFSKIYEVLC